METQRKAKQSHRTTHGAPRCDCPIMRDGEEQTSLPGTTSADEGSAPDCAERGRAGSRELRIKLGTKVRIATWNVRSMAAGKMQNVIEEARDNNIKILGLSEHRWAGQGHFSPLEGGKMIFSGKERPGQSGVAIFLDKILEDSLIGYKPISDRILSVRLRGAAQNISLLQVYAPTSIASDEEKEDFFSQLQNEIDLTNPSDR